MAGIYDEGEVATLVRSREIADGIMRELQATMPRALPVPPAPVMLEPEELLPPPPSMPPSNIFESSWSTTMPIAGAPAMLRRPDLRPTKKLRRKKKTPSRLHWAVLAMSLAIGGGLWRDPPARHDAVRQIKAESHRVMVGAKSEGQRLQRFVKLVSARII